MKSTGVCVELTSPDCSVFIGNDNFHLLCISSLVTAIHMGVVPLPTPTAHDYVVSHCL